MSCTTPGTRTQLANTTSPCMKQQISTPPRGAHGEAHSEMRWLCLLSAWRSAAHPRSHRGLLLAGTLTPAWLSHAVHPQPPWCLPHIWGAGTSCRTAHEAGIAMGQQKQKGGAQGSILCLCSTAKNRYRATRVAPGYPYGHLLPKERGILGGRFGVW